MSNVFVPGLRLTANAPLDATDTVFPISDSYDFCSEIGGNIITMMMVSGSKWEAMDAECVAGQIELTRGLYGSTAQDWPKDSCALSIPQPCEVTDCVDPILTISNQSATKDQPFALNVPIAGTGPFALDEYAAPDGVTAKIVGNLVVFDGVPTIAGPHPIAAAILNCCGTGTGGAIVTVT